MLLAYLHPGDLSGSEFLLALLVLAFLALVIIGLPIGVIFYVIYKNVRARRAEAEVDIPRRA